MNTLSFPPVVLTHLTKDNALFHGACAKGINKVITTHQLSHLTAVPVTLLLKSSKLATETKDWVKSIAGLSNGETENGYINQYGQGTLKGDGYDLDLEDTDEAQDSYLLFSNPGNRAGHNYAYGYGYGDGDGYGDGYGYGDGSVYGDGNGYGYEYDHQTL